MSQPTHPNIARLATDYGMVLVLLAICALFSVITYTDQSPTDEAAAKKLAAEIVRQAGVHARVLIAVPAQPADAAFADTLATALKEQHVEPLEVVKGEPKDARVALQKLAAAGKLDVIAVNATAAAWLVFADLANDFPALGQPRVMSPQPYKWPNFLKRSNLLNIANQIAVIAILAIGMTMVVITGGIDLSVGSLIALSAVVTTLIIRDVVGAQQASAVGMVLAGAVGIVVCGAVGAFSGLMITLFHVPPFIVTLAMMLMASGTASRLTHDQSVYQIPDSFMWLGRGADLGIPNAVLLMAILYVAAHIVMSRTVLGRYIYAVGGNRVAARYSGVPVRRVLLASYVFSGLFAGLGGVVMASQLKSGAPTFGQMYELYVIAAVVVGGASLNGGKGRIFGTLIGAFTIAVIQNGMNLTNVESSMQKVVLGLVILGAVLLDTMGRRGWRIKLLASE